MAVYHLIEFNNMMLDRLEMRLIKKGDLPFTPLGLKKICPNWEILKEAIKSLSRRSKANQPKSVMLMLQDLLQTTTPLAAFKAGDKRTTSHQHFFLPKDY